MGFWPTFQSNFHLLAEQFYKSIPTHIIIKNVACSNKEDVWLFTNLASVPSNTLKYKPTVVFNTYIKIMTKLLLRRYNATILFDWCSSFIHFYKLFANINIHFLLDYCRLKDVWLWSTDPNNHTGVYVVIVISGISIVNNPVIIIAIFASCMLRALLWFISMLQVLSRMHPLLLHL